jgi:hypothetical protein
VWALRPPSSRLSRPAQTILNDWIPIINQWFYVCLGYSIIGFCGVSWPSKVELGES